MGEKRSCLECGEEIYGRSDKKFCSDQCRNTYNNKLHAIANKYIRRVNYILRKNRRILEEMIEKSGKEAIKVHRNKLMEEGFNFDYYTNIYKTKSGHYYYFNYEYGFMKLADDYFTVVLREDYLKD